MSCCRRSGKGLWLSSAVRMMKSFCLFYSGLIIRTDMERYLDGQELSPEEVASALKSAVTRGELFPVMCGVATKNLGTTAVSDLLVEGVPSPAKKGSPIEVEGASTAAFIFKTVADPFSGRINVFRVLKGTISSDATLANVRTHGKERVGALLTPRARSTSRRTSSARATSARLRQAEGRS